MRSTARNSHREEIDTQISALKLPSLPKLPKLPIPSLPGKKKETATPPPPPPKPVAKEIKIGDSVVDRSVKKPVPKTSETAFTDGLPKFYVPKTSRYEFKANAKGQNATPFDVRVGVETNTLNMRINENQTFRNTDPYTPDLVWARPGWSSDEARVGVRIALRNVLGNANLFASDMAQIATSISCVYETANMKEFIRAVGLSDLYRKRFFEGTSNTRFIECNFKHFLGRAPHSQAEVSEHIRIINEEGYNAEINSYIDSDEYDTLFGESRIPAVNFRGGHPYNNDMNKLAILNGGYSTSDRLSKRASLVTGDASNFTPFSITRGMPEAWVGEMNALKSAGPVMEFPSDRFWNPQPDTFKEEELAWIGRMGNWTKYWYKESSVYKEIMKPVLSHSAEEEAEAAAILKYGSSMAKNYMM